MAVSKASLDKTIAETEDLLTGLRDPTHKLKVRSNLTAAYLARFELTKDISDLRKGLDISHHMVVRSPVPYAIQAERVERHLERVARYIQYFDNAEEVKSLIEAVEGILEANEIVTTQGSIRTSVLLVELSLHCYVLTADISALPNLVARCQNIAVRRQNPASVIDSLQALKRNVTILAVSVTDGAVREKASKFLHEIITTRSSHRKDLTSQLIKVQQLHGGMISEYALAPTNGTALPDERMRKQATIRNPEPSSGNGFSSSTYTPGSYINITDDYEISEDEEEEVVGKDKPTL